MEIRLYNSLTSKKEVFKSINPNQVGLYCCGPTVYGDAHIGHAKSALTYDLLIRFLRGIDYKVRYVRNYTDVGHLTNDSEEGDDKIILKSKIDNLEPMELVDLYTHRYEVCMEKLNNLRPNISPRATGHIVEIIDTIKTLIANGYAYELDGDVYFDIEKYPQYGQLQGLSLDEVLSKETESTSLKRNASDFAVWKKAPEGHLLKWSSPWGKGYPGWHIECSVMATKYLGETFDIHGGGEDLKYLHHECEIAQAHGASGKPIANYWIHNNMVTVNGLKMSKSLGNYITLEDAFKEYDPVILRYFLINSHYRSVTDYNPYNLEDAIGRFSELKVMIETISKRITSLCSADITSAHTGKFSQKIFNILSDDLNAPLAIEVMNNELAKLVSCELNSDSKIIFCEITKLYKEIFGIDFLRD